MPQDWFAAHAPKAATPPASEDWFAANAPKVSSQLETASHPTSATDAHPELPQIHALADDPFVRAGSGALKALKGLMGMAAHPIDSAKAVIYDAPAEMFEKSRTAETLPEKIAYGAAGAIPLVGPMAAHAGEEIAADRAPELIGELATMAALPSGARGARNITRTAGRGVASVARSTAESELLARVAKRGARPLGAAVGAGVGGMVGMPTAGAVVGSEVGEMIRAGLRKKAAPVVVEPQIMEPSPMETPRPVAGELPAAPIEMEPEPPPKTTKPPAPTPSKPVKSKAAQPRTAAEQLRDKMSDKELTRVRKELGTQDVKIARYEPRQGADGKFLGVSDPVYVVPPEFLEQAQMMGLRARGHTALEQSYRGPSVPRPVEAPVAAEASPEPTVSLNRERHRAEHKWNHPRHRR